MNADSTPGETSIASRQGKRFFRSLSGTAAIEFAMIAPVFFGLVFSAFEIGFLFVRVAMLDHAVAAVSKSVYIGSVTHGAVTSDDLKTSVCDYMSAVVPGCASEVTVELSQINSLSDLPATGAVCRDSTTDINPSTSFNPGAANSIVFLRVCVTVDLLTPGLPYSFGNNLTKTDSGRYEVVSSMAFMNEPF